MSTFKKILTGSLAALTIFAGAGTGLFATAPAQAATQAELQAQVAALLAQIAALQGTSSSCYLFTTDLTIGSNGEAVRQLQSYLNRKGFTVAVSGAGSAGMESTYFGGLTQTALARYQAAMGVSPAAGYFGPLTRARVNADCTTVPNPNPNPNPGPDNDELEGDEANLSDFELRSEDSNGNEGENGVEIATAEFDVEDGDIRIGRIELMASSTDLSASTRPWDYFDAVTVIVNGDEVFDMDVDSRADWREVGDDVYRLTMTGIDEIVRMDDRAEITFAFDIADNIDSEDLDQEFDFYIEDRGIRAVDAEGIQQYIGDDSETVSFGFGEEESGYLTVESSDEDPDASILVSDEDEESDEYTVFAFEIDNDDDVDALITDLSIGVTTSGGGIDADDVIRRATLVADGDEFDGDLSGNVIDFDDIDVEIGGEDTMTFELMITLVRNATTTELTFDVDGAADIEAEGLDSGDDSVIGGSAESATHSVADLGIMVTPRSTDQRVVTVTPVDSSYGQYTIRFSVEAIDDDVYIATTSASTTPATTGVTYEIEGSEAFVGATTSFLSSTAGTTNGFYRVREGRTETFTLTVTLNPTTSGIFQVNLDTITFNDVASFTGASIFTVDSDNDDFQTDPVNIPS